MLDQEAVESGIYNLIYSLDLISTENAETDLQGVHIYAIAAIAAIARVVSNNNEERFVLLSSGITEIDGSFERNNSLQFTISFENESVTSVDTFFP